MSKTKIAEWVLSGLVSAFLIVASAGGKVTEWDGKAEMFATMGWSEHIMVRIAILEAVLALLFLVPSASFIGAILLSAYLGGAVATHVRINEPFLFPVGLGIVMWIALGLRDSRVFPMAFPFLKKNVSQVNV